MVVINKVFFRGYTDHISGVRISFLFFGFTKNVFNIETKVIKKLKLQSVLIYTGSVGLVLRQSFILSGLLNQ